MKNIVGVLALCLAIGAAAFIWRGYANWVERDAKLKLEGQHYTKTVFENQFTHLVWNGTVALDNDNLPLAKREFEAALKIEPYGKNAVIGLEETLRRFCKGQQLYCTEHEKWKGFLEAQFPERRSTAK